MMIKVVGGGGGVDMRSVGREFFTAAEVTTTALTEEQMAYERGMEEAKADSFRKRLALAVAEKGPYIRVAMWEGHNLRIDVVLRENIFDRLGPADGAVLVEKEGVRQKVLWFNIDHHRIKALVYPNSKRVAFKLGTSKRPFQLCVGNPYRFTYYLRDLVVEMRQSLCHKLGDYGGVVVPRVADGGWRLIQMDMNIDIRQDVNPISIGVDTQIPTAEGVIIGLYAKMLKKAWRREKWPQSYLRVESRDHQFKDTEDGRPGVRIDNETGKKVAGEVDRFKRILGSAVRMYDDDDHDDNDDDTDDDNNDGNRR